MKKKIIYGIFLMLILTVPAILWAETSQKVPAPVPGKEVQPSNDAGKSSQAAQDKTSSIPIKVVGKAYDKNALTMLPGSPTMSSAQGTTAPVEKISPVPHSGNPGAYRILLAKAGPYAGELVIDLGFSNYMRLADVMDDMSPFKEGDVIAFQEKEGEVRKTDEAELYSYQAWIKRVLDGNTIEVVMDLGFGFTTQETLRLRAIEAPEIKTPAGIKAKEFLEKTLTGASPFFIKTSKSDKSDRYLADVFITDKTGEELYLNNELIEKGHAVKVKE